MLIFLVCGFLAILIIIGLRLNKTLEDINSNQKTAVKAEDKNNYNFSKNVGFIGDSITYGEGGFPNASQVAVREMGSDFFENNQGIKGSSSEDWVSDDQKMTKNSAKIFKNSGVDVVMIMLGSNDANKSISAKSYKENIKRIIKTLKDEGEIKRIILNQPPYAESFDNGKNRLLAEYSVKLDELLEPGLVLKGDREAYEYFKKNPSQLGDGLHPNSEGYHNLGHFWAKALSQVY